jgi:predicted esterase
MVPNIGWICLLLLSTVTSVAMAQGPASKGGARGFLSYDVSAPFDLKEIGTQEKDGVRVRDVEYASHGNGHARVKAFVVQPAMEGRHAAVLFFHWLGKPNGDRTEFLEDAVTLAKKGTVSLLIQGHFPWTEEPTEAEADARQIVEQSIEVRRALDMLRSLPGVDASRIAFVGHDYGAMFGAVASGVETRVKAYVFMAGMGTFSEWSLKYWPGTAVNGAGVYRAAMKPLDPVGHISHAASVPKLFQFSDSDIYISKSEAGAFFKAASGPKEIRTYACGHELNLPEVRAERLAWLEKQLRLGVGKK